MFAATMSTAFALLPLTAYAAPHVLVWAGGIEINTLDPLTPGAFPNVYLSQTTMAYLTTSGDGPPVPELAARVPTKKNGGISADGKTITFELRPHLRWSDGAPLTSGDVAFTVALVNNPKTNVADRTGYRLITRVETPNETTAIIHLSQPYGPIVNSIFSDASAPVLPKHLLAGRDVNTADYMQLPVGAGPFRYTKWVRGDRVELGPNPFYFRGTPKLKRIVYRIIPSTQSSAIALKTGESDLWPAATLNEAELANDIPSVKRITVSGARPVMLTFNTKSPSVTDVRVRDALRLALNRTSIVRRSFRGGAELDESIVSKSDPAHLALPHVPYDVVKAEALLEAAGWKAGSDGLRSKRGTPLHVDLVGGAGSPAAAQLLELVRADWQRIGVAVDTRYVTTGILFSDDAKQGVLKGGKFDVALFSYGQTRANGIDSDFTCANAAPAGQNYSRICDKRLDALFARYDATYEVADAIEIAREIQRRIDALLPAIIITKRNEYYIVRDTITGYRPKPFSPFAGTIFDTDVRK
jgi:peptide/nickel transport system substrate-binding protein